MFHLSQILITFLSSGKPLSLYFQLFLKGQNVNGKDDFLMCNSSGFIMYKDDCTMFSLQRYKFSCKTSKRRKSDKIVVKM